MMHVTRVHCKLVWFLLAVRREVDRSCFASCALQRYFIGLDAFGDVRVRRCVHRALLRARALLCGM